MLGRHRFTVRVLSAFALTSISSLAAPARAQTTGFAVDRFDPSERGSEWFVLDSLDLRGQTRPALGVVADYAYHPLIIYNADGSTRAAILSDQLFLHLGGSVVMWDRLRLGVNLPVAAFEAGGGGVSNGATFSSPSSVAVGDLRVSGDVRLLGVYRSPFELAAGAAVYAPTGSRSDFTGDGTFRIEPHLLASGELGMFVYAARVGFQYRPADHTFAGSGLGSELVFGGSAGVRAVDGKLVVGPELYGRSVVTSDEGAFRTRNTPIEALFGAHYTAGAIRFGAGAGPGLTRGYGEPGFRVVAGVEWAPAPPAPPPSAPPPAPPPAAPPPDPDRDHDGVPNATDACPDVAGVATSDPKTNGCPPPPDADADGIPDAEDACPDKPGPRTSDPKTNGCPPPPPDPDRDKDGIPNEVDACPDEPGPANTDPKKNGCPKAFVAQGQIRITDQIKFRFNSAELDPAGDPVLQAVLKVLSEHPEIKKVRIEGHTDNVGGAAYNLILSKNRANAVQTWLVKHGVDKARLEADGFGLTRPLAENKTDAGRRENRRVEFHIVDPPPTQQP